ncbi:uncharacterized protein B0H18DRAFT_1126478 [Fomitopsis serialis]|uniref:uncharacterized protein n=1 Tax=Fomitopsis serialis TaxID=139415 RepID=UPI002007B062|nr:uncharacterized protein B0H18DRAFT_1126478 [Neoantrodia serialis]KAH9913237.1 hypothetical protein B0H18DRAFT_1126478 [Neoantrodia serialis]
MQHYVLDFQYSGVKAQLAVSHRRRSPKYIERFVREDLVKLGIPREPGARTTSSWLGSVPAIRCAWNIEHRGDASDALRAAIDALLPARVNAQTKNERKAFKRQLLEMNISQIVAEITDTEPASQAVPTPAQPSGASKRARSPTNGGGTANQAKRLRQQASTSSTQTSAPATQPTADAGTRLDVNPPARGSTDTNTRPDTGSSQNVTGVAGPACAAGASDTGTAGTAARAVLLDISNGADVDEVAVKQEVPDDAEALWGADAGTANVNVPPGDRNGVEPSIVGSIVGSLKPALDEAAAAADARLEELQRDLEDRRDETAWVSDRLTQREARLRASEAALREQEREMAADAARTDAALTRAEGQLYEARTRLSAPDTQLAETATQVAEAEAKLAHAETQAVRGQMRLAEVTTARDRLAQEVAALQADLQAVQERKPSEAEQQVTQDTITSLRVELDALRPEAEAIHAVAILTEEGRRRSTLKRQAVVDRRQAVELKAQNFGKKVVRTQLDLLGDISVLRERVEMFTQQLEGERAAHRESSGPSLLYDGRGRDGLLTTMFPMQR